MRSIDLRVDVTEAAGLGEPAHVALTVTAPDELPTRPHRLLRQAGSRLLPGLLHRGLPGPGSGAGAQAAWHAERGWILVAVDHLGVGDSSQHDAERLAYTPVAAASQAAETEVRQKLAAGTLIDGLAPWGIRSPSASASRWAARSPSCSRVGSTATTASACWATARCAPTRRRSRGRRRSGCPGWHATPCRPTACSPTGRHSPVSPPRECRAEHDNGMAWGFHYDDVDLVVVQRDMEDYPLRGGDLPPGLGQHPRDGGAVVGGAGRRPGRGGGGALPGPGRAGRARRAGRPPRRAPGLRVVAQRRLLRVPAHGAHAQLRRYPQLFWQRIETWADWVRTVRNAQP